MIDRTTEIKVQILSHKDLYEWVKQMFEKTRGQKTIDKRYLRNILDYEGRQLDIYSDMDTVVRELVEEHFIYDTTPNRRKNKKYQLFVPDDMTFITTHKADGSLSSGTRQSTAKNRAWTKQWKEA